MVTDGAISDAAYIRGQNPPIFAVGVTHRRPCRDGPGEVHVPVATDGKVIDPGDPVTGDDDGVLCVRSGWVEAVFEAASAKFDAEPKQRANTQAGTHEASRGTGGVTR